MSAILLTSCASSQSARSAYAPPPATPAAEPTQPAKAAPDMQAVLDQLSVLGAKPVENLTPAQARTNPSAADAAKAVMAAKGMQTTPDASVTTRDVPYGTHQRQFARIYKPADVANASDLGWFGYYCSKTEADQLDPRINLV